MRTIKLDTYACPSWNTLYSCRHWTKRQEMADYAHQIVRLSTIGETPVNGKVEIVVTAYLKRLIDPDNVCCKLAIDGLKLSGIIKDDSCEYISSVTTRVVKSKTNYTIIEIYDGTDRRD